MSIRAIASEQLNGQIVESLTAGLLVVDREGRVEIAEPGRPSDARRPRRRGGPRLSRRSSTTRPSCRRSSRAASDGVGRAAAADCRVTAAR